MYHQWVPITQSTYYFFSIVASLCTLSSTKAYANNCSANSVTHATPMTRPVVRTHPLDNLGVLNDNFPLEHGHRIEDILRSRP